MQQLTFPGEIVKKRNELVRCKINISSLGGSRILANLIACVHHGDTQFKDTYRVPVKDFMSDLGGRSYSEIKAICRELAKATAEIEEPDPDGPHPIFRIYTFFSSITYRKGIIEARFNQEMRPFLLDLRRCFTQYNLMEYLTLPSFYSQRIFEILKSWSNAPEVILSVAELHRLLDTPASFRTDFKSFRVRVLEKAYKDIIEKTTMCYEWEPIKRGRSVISVRFIFSKIKSMNIKDQKMDDKKKKQSDRNNYIFLTVTECRKQHSNDCIGGHQKKVICDFCHSLP